MPSDTSTEPSPLFGARMAGALWLTVEDESRWISEVRIASSQLAPVEP